jgi:hypothetical protein
MIYNDALRAHPRTPAPGVLGASPYLGLDGDHRSFVDLVARQVGSALTDAQAYDAAQRRTEALAELDRARTEFFTGISHELRTPGPAEDALADTAEPLAGARRAGLAAEVDSPDVGPVRDPPGDPGPGARGRDDAPPRRARPARGAACGPGHGDDAGRAALRAGGRGGGRRRPGRRRGRLPRQAVLPARAVRARPQARGRRAAPGGLDPDALHGRPGRAPGRRRRQRCGPGGRRPDRRPRSPRRGRDRPGGEPATRGRPRPRRRRVPRLPEPSGSVLRISGTDLQDRPSSAGRRRGRAGARRTAGRASRPPARPARSGPGPRR